MSTYYDLAEILCIAEDPYHRVAELLFRCSEPDEVLFYQRQAAKTLVLWSCGYDGDRISTVLDALRRIDGLTTERLAPEYLLADFIRLFPVRQGVQLQEVLRRRLLANDIMERLRLVDDPKWVRDYGHSHRHRQEQLDNLTEEERDDLLHVYWHLASDLLNRRLLVEK